jgi:hypothetical protein
MSYQYLPGTSVVTIDGGLAARRTPTSKVSVVIGTAGQGLADDAYQVIDRSIAAKDFGYNGSLVRGMEELAQGGCDNIYLFRIGSKAATLTGIGRVEVPSGETDDDDNPIMMAKDASNVGFDITFGTRQANVSTIYQLYYDGAGALRVFLNGNLVYSNDPTNPVDTGDLDIDGTAVAGKALLNTTAANNASDWAKSIPLSNSLIAASVQVSGTGNEKYPPVALYLGDSGLSLEPSSPDYDPCQVYEALEKAFSTLEMMTIGRVYVPNAYWDTPNVAFYNSTSVPTTDENNPANGKALGWLKTTKSADGSMLFQWAHKVTDSGGNTVSLPTLSSGADRLAKGFHEVSFPYQIARFCAKQSQNQGGCVSPIGFRPPKNYKTTGLKAWIGYLPTYDTDGNATNAGAGLCGNPYLVGTVSSKLSTVAHDVATHAYRSPGFFQTVSATNPNEMGEYDEGPVIDKNGYPVNLGAYVLPVGDWAYLKNGYSQLYAGSIAGAVAGYSSSLDEASAITNKVIPGLTQIYRVSMSQLNDLTFAKVNMLRFKGDGQAPVMLHDYTAATSISDYTKLITVLIKFLVCQVIFQEADKFVGQSSTDGLTLAALRTALDKRMLELVKRGYLAKAPTYNIYTTDADRRVGRVFIDIVFNPADELLQVQATISAGRA